MPTASEDAAVQAIEVITGTLSAVACIAVSRKIWKERSNHVTNSMLLSLFFIDFVLGIVYAIGRSATTVSGLCQFQGFLLQWFEVAAMLWNVLMSYLMYQWIVRRKHPKRMEKTIKKAQIALFACSFIVAIAFLGAKAYGGAYLWCWVKAEYIWMRVLFFEAILLFAWISNIFMLQLVFTSLRTRFRQTSVHARLGNLLDSTVGIQRKLILYVSAFVFLWAFAVINRFVEYGTGETNAVTSILQVIFLPLQGFVNALLYGDYINFKKAITVKDVTNFLKLKKDSEFGNNNEDANYREVQVEPNVEVLTKTNHIKKYFPKKYSIFVTTLNVGEASLQSIVGDIKDWIVEGHDVYSIGLQECIDLNGLREAILNHLGGPEKYAMFTANIGSGNTRLGYHGFIALTVFVRRSELLNGNIQATSSTTGAMATGTDLIITTAQNKGAVGIPLQIHDTSIGFVTCHLPSDSKGKSKLTKRNASAHAILKEVILAPEDLGFDLHLQHDHILVFGDLNYRMETDGVGGGVNSLTGVAVACQLEKSILNDDPLWMAKRYNLLRHVTDPLHPSIEEVKLIHQAKVNSRGAWKSVLRADELRSIMDDGDAFFGFDEPMPCFPPSYKRKKGKVEGDCGDYSTFSAIIKGYSHTGYIENILARPSTNRGSPNRPMSKKFLRNSEPLAVVAPPADGSPAANQTGKLSAISEDSNERDSSQGGKISGDGKENIIDSDLNDSTDVDDSIRETDIDDKSEEKLAALRSKRRRAMLTKEAAPILEKEESVYETDPSKLRPPSYTDRILLHSLPDRQKRLTVQAYDFCDTLRVSDHRAVSMTLLLEVNANCIYNGAAEATEVVKKSKKNDSPTASTKSTDIIPTPLPEDLIQKEPKFELYELIITELSVTILDLKFDEDEEEELRESTAFPSSSNSRPTSEKLTKHTSMKKEKKDETQFEEFNPMYKNKLASSSPERKKKGGVKFNTEEPSVDIEMQSVDKPSGRVESNTTENSNESVDQTQSHQQVSNNSDDSQAIVPVTKKAERKKSFWARRLSSKSTNNNSNNNSSTDNQVTPARKSRKKSIFAVFFNYEDEQEETDQNQQDLENQDKQTDIEDEDAILRDMARESLDWKNTLHQPGDWRKKVLEEQRKEKEKEKTSPTAPIPIKKKHKSDDKMIHSLTVVFPLPAKDPLLVYRRIYDYSQAFDIEDKSQKAFETIDTNNTNITKEELLKAMTQFQWYPKPTITYSNDKSSFPRNQMKFESDHKFKLKGCASYELGAHALIKFSNRLGYEFGSSVICLSHLIHKDPKAIHYSYMTDIPLSAGGQRRGTISGKFALKFIPSALSDN